MISAYNSHSLWWAPDARTPPRLPVCDGIQVFRGYRDLAPVEECGRGPCSRGRHSLLMQHSTQCSAACQSRQRRTTEQSHTTHTRAAQDSTTPRHTKLAGAHRGAAQRSTHQRSMRIQGQHRQRDASLMHSREPTPSRPHREVEVGSPYLSRGIAPAGLAAGYAVVHWVAI